MPQSSDVPAVPGPTPTDAERRALDVEDEEQLALHVARRCHLDDQSKVDVAKALGLSRFQVARLIADARRRGQVRIEIGPPDVSTTTSAATSPKRSAPPARWSSTAPAVTPASPSVTWPRRWRSC